ncbi:MAG TPA: hypothetical protein VFQ53_06985 [Kofleriaceae bacterium]|nr:hypothetical protein [Kofleriaceae bacterium]
MTTLSSAGWVVHDIGLATTIGGSLFGQLALEPSLDQVSRAAERDRVSEKAWNRFSWLKLAGHVAFAVPWFVGRKMLSGNEVSARARALTLTKDGLVIASLVTGVSSFVIGQILGRKVRRGQGPEQAKARREAHESTALERAVSVLGALNTIASTGVLAVTSLLAMEGSESLRFSVRSRDLP